ncbi:MAG: hypothetical protein IPN05_19790 [Sulfuritalea sp.]|nr:hypothetical protein [Sulfuritalea sp.]
MVTITGGSVITIASGASSGTVSVAAPGRGRVLDRSTVSRSITGATGGNFETLAASTGGGDAPAPVTPRHHHG